ncbi:MAG: ferrochelatase, partial [Chlamydiia bacterium]|nr:ferrochelatase [Chlamydiia bacterium]
KYWLLIPLLSFVSSYPYHPALIEIFREIGWNYQPHSYDHVLLSFHGLPEGQVRNADTSGKCLASGDCCNEVTRDNAYCYRAHCMRTARALVEALDIPEKKYSVCFQSRLGKVPWLQPYASDVIQELGKRGAERVLVFCPSFVCDCIETTHEIGVEYQELFHKAGGGELVLVQGLNTHPSWVRGLREILLDYSHPASEAPTPLAAHCEG